MTINCAFYADSMKERKKIRRGTDEDRQKYKSSN